METDNKTKKNNEAKEDTIDNQHKGLIEQLNNLTLSLSRGWEFETLRETFGLDK